MGSDGVLARVTYLPGVTPPGAASEPIVPSHMPIDPPVLDHAVLDQAVLDHAVLDHAVLDQAVLDHAMLSQHVPEKSAPTLEHEKHRAENVSMHALTRRGQSRWELHQILLSRELEPSVVDAELDRLERVGLLDDVALAETIVRTQHERKGLGRSALVAELRRRRIDQNAIDLALEQVGVDDEALRAGQLAERRALQLKNVDHDTAVRRLSGYLQRKGYSSDTVRSAVLAALPRQSSGVRFR